MAITLISILLTFWLLLAYLSKTVVKARIKPTTRTLSLLGTLRNLIRLQRANKAGEAKNEGYPDNIQQPRDEKGRFRAYERNQHGEWERVVYYDKDLNATQLKNIIHVND